MSKCLLDVVVGKTKKEFGKNHIHARVSKAVRRNQNILASSCVFFKTGAIFATRPDAGIHWRTKLARPSYDTGTSQNRPAVSNFSVSDSGDLHCVDIHVRPNTRTTMKIRAAKSKYFDRIVRVLKIGAVFQLGPSLNTLANKTRTTLVRPSYDARTSQPVGSVFRLVSVFHHRNKHVRVLLVRVYENLRRPTNNRPAGSNLCVSGP